MSNEPVVYVDGIRVDNAGDRAGDGLYGDDGSRLDDINWEAVERIEILKGASAATLYGSEASSGVIQIFTKSGRSGETRASTRVELGRAGGPRSDRASRRLRALPGPGGCPSASCTAKPSFPSRSSRRTSSAICWNVA